MSGLALKDVLSTALAFAAFCLAIVNFVRTSRVADRQFASTYVQDVIKWVVESIGAVSRIQLYLIGEADGTFNVDNNKHLDQIFWQLSTLEAQGSLLFPRSTIANLNGQLPHHPLVEIVSDASKHLAKVYRGIGDGVAPSIIDSAVFSVAQKDLVERAEQELNLRHRYKQAMAALK